MATPSVLTAGVEAAPAARVGLASGVLSSGRYVGSIVASILLSALVADDGDGVTTMLVMSTVALVLSLGAAANLPSHPTVGGSVGATRDRRRGTHRNRLTRPVSQRWLSSAA